MAVVFPNGEMLNLLSWQGGNPLSPRQTLTSPRMTWIACAFRLVDVRAEDCTSTSTAGWVRALRTRAGDGAAVLTARTEAKRARMFDECILGFVLSCLDGDGNDVLIIACLKKLI